MQTIKLMERYHLQPIQIEDAQAIFEAIDSQREYLGRWLPFVAITYRLEQTQSVTGAMTRDPNNPVFTIRHDGDFVGLIGFKCANSETRTIEIGYWLCEQHQGRGVISRAVEALCRYAFEQLNMLRVEIKCGVENLPSNRIPQRLGMRFDREQECAEQMSSGEWINLNVYVAEKPNK